jgi:hypothetical protein
VWRSGSVTRASRASVLARRHAAGGGAAGSARRREMGGTVRQGPCGLGREMHCYCAVVELSGAGVRMAL